LRALPPAGSRGRLATASGLIPVAAAGRCRGLFWRRSTPAVGPSTRPPPPLSPASTAVAALAGRPAGGRPAPPPPAEVDLGPAWTDDAFSALDAAQRALPRPSLADDARTLLVAGSGPAGTGTGFLATLEAPSTSSGGVRGGGGTDGPSAGREDAADALAGFPQAALSPYALCPSSGLPFVCLTRMSGHCRNLEADPRCSLHVAAGGMDAPRLTIWGRAEKVDREAQADVHASLREAWLTRHPDAGWCDFGDFAFYRMTGTTVTAGGGAAAAPLAARVVGGFARAGPVDAAAWAAGAPDPVAPFGAPVCGHMNDDHADSIAQLASSCAAVGGAVRAAQADATIAIARMIAIDRLGATLSIVCGPGGGETKVRVPWPGGAEVTERGAVKTALVALTRGEQ